MLIAIAAAIGFLYILISWVAETQSQAFWNLMSAVNIGGALLSVVGMYLLLTEINQTDTGHAEPGAAPNGGPAAPVDNLNTSGGPPSVS